MFKSWFTPSPRLVLQIQQRTFNIKAKDTLLHSALLQGVPFPHGCRVGGCGLCKCRLLSGSVKQLPDIATHLTIKEKRDGIIYACCSIPLTDVNIELLDVADGCEC